MFRSSSTVRLQGIHCSLKRVATKCVDKHNLANVNLFITAGTDVLVATDDFFFFKKSVCRHIKLLIFTFCRFKDPPRLFSKSKRLCKKILRNTFHTIQTVKSSRTWRCIVGIVMPDVSEDRSQASHL
jgi:hypothetical protein